MEIEDRVARLGEAYLIANSGEALLSKERQASYCTENPRFESRPVGLCDFCAKKQW
jgi:hypothetical protein